MHAVPKSLQDKAGVSYAVRFQPPTKFNHVAVVAVYDGDFLAAEMKFGEREPDYFYIDDIQVYRSQRQGIGSQLLTIAEAYAVEHGFSEVHGTIMAYEPTSADCAFLRSWYTAHGYVLTYTEGHPRKEYCGDITKKIKPAQQGATANAVGCPEFSESPSDCRRHPPHDSSLTSAKK